MKITPTGSVSRVQHGANITDGPILAKGERRFLAERVWATYILGADGWKLQHIDISGSVIKKDGTPGQLDTTKTWYPGHGERPPVWVAALIATLAPQGALRFNTAEYDIQES